MVGQLPFCTEPRIPLDGPGAAIDRRIKTLVQEGLSIYRVDADQLRSLNPGLILTQTHCAVCAVSEREGAQRGGALVGRLAGRMDAIAAKAAAAPVKPTVACIEWLDPMMAAGNWM